MAARKQATEEPRVPEYVIRGEGVENQLGGCKDIDTTYLAPVFGRGICDGLGSIAIMRARK